MDHRPTALPCLICLAFATAKLTGGQLLAAPADLPPVRGLEEVGHAQVELRSGFWGAAQHKDGFLISYFIVQKQDQRWEDLRLEHQMYNAGHFFELAVAHAQLTGDPKVLNAAKRFADRPQPSD